MLSLSVYPGAVYRLFTWSSRSAVQLLPVLGKKVRRVHLFADDLDEMKNDYSAVSQVPDTPYCSQGFRACNAGSNFEVLLGCS